MISAARGPLAPGANAIVAPTVLLIPGVFGFIAWELKENFKLYRASRGKALPEAVIGAHGETMTALLVPGFHSGTLPKLFARLRHAARREDEAEHAARGQAPRKRAKGEGARGRFREGGAELEGALRHFVEREMLCLFAVDPRWLVHLPPTMSPPETLIWPSRLFGSTLPMRIPFPGTMRAPFLASMGVGHSAWRFGSKATRTGRPRSVA